MVNTPEPCSVCSNLYYDAMRKDDPTYLSECKMGLKMGLRGCSEFSTEEKFNEEGYNPETGECGYCKGVGACPRCWGRAALNEAEKNLAEMGEVLHGFERQIKNMKDEKRDIIKNYEEKVRKLEANQKDQFGEI